MHVKFAVYWAAYYKVQILSLLMKYIYYNVNTLTCDEEKRQYTTNVKSVCKDTKIQQMQLKERVKY